MASPSSTTAPAPFDSSPTPNCASTPLPALSPHLPSSSLRSVLSVALPSSSPPFTSLLPEAKRADHIAQITSLIDDCSTDYPTHPLLVVGDFNSYHQAWHQPPPPGVHPSACASALANWIAHHPLTIFNQPGVHTHVQADARTIIDLVLGNDPSLVSSLSQRHSTHWRTDHLPFTIELNLSACFQPARPPDDRPRIRWNHHDNPEAWQEALPVYLSDALLLLQPALHSLTQPVSSRDAAQALLDSLYADFERIVRDSCLVVVGTKIKRQDQVRWFGYPGVHSAYRSYRSALRAYHQDPQLYSAYRDARQAWSKVSTEARLDATRSLAQSIQTPNSKVRWTQFSRTTASTFTSLASVADASGSLPIDHAGALNNVAAAFIANSQPPELPSDIDQYTATVRRVEAWADPAHPSLIDPSQPPLPAHVSDSWTFTKEEVEGQCKGQYVNTAPGPDTILPVFLKHGGDALWSALAALYTFSWQHSVTPLAWREANVMSLYKGDDGDKSQPDSYRPISMTSIIARTFEHLIHTRLVNLLDPPPPSGSSAASSISPFRLANTQFGFRSTRRTTDAIQYLLAGVQRVMRMSDSKGKLTAPVLYLDLQKAFDRVDHSILLQRLANARITGKAWLWIRSFLTGRRMRVVDNTESSDWHSIHYGVPQGAVLSPLLFTVFIDTLASKITSDSRCSLLSPILYADDGAIAPNPLVDSRALPSMKAYTVKYLKQLETALALLNDWCDESRMLFGARKTQLVLYSTADTIDSTPYSTLRLCNFTIAVVSHYRYLGVWLDSRLSYTKHRKEALNQARFASMRITRIAARAPDPDLPSLRSLVLGFLIPSFSYAIEVWAHNLDHATRQSLQSHIIRPFRAALCLPKTTHQLGTLHLCGLPSVHALLLKAELSHVHRMSTLPIGHPMLEVHITTLRPVTAPRSNALPHNLLAPECALPLSIRLATNTVPRLWHPDSTLRPLLKPTTQAVLTAPVHPSLPDVTIVTQYWDQPGAVAKRNWGQAHLKSAHLRATAAHSDSDGFRRALVPDVVRDIARNKTIDEWNNLHTTDPTVPHGTSAPLTVCKPDHGLAPILSKESTKHARRRARLLMGRARTGTVLLRFKKAGDPVVNPHCTHPTCASSIPPPLDSIEHALLHCPRHADARDEYFQELTQHRKHKPVTFLTLSTILLATLPSTHKSWELRQLSADSNRFLDAVAHDRKRDGLVPLDTG